MKTSFLPWIVSLVLVLRSITIQAQSSPSTEPPIPEHAQESKSPDEQNERVVDCGSKDAPNTKPAPPANFENILGRWVYGFGINTPTAYLKFFPDARRPQNTVARIVASYRPLEKATAAQRSAKEYDVFSLGTKIQVSTAHIGTAPEAPFDPILVDNGCVGCKSFTAAERNLVIKSYKLAYEYVYYANEVVDFMQDAHYSWRDNMWVDGYNASLKDSQDGKSMTVSAANWSPRAWFGQYDGLNLFTLHQVVDTLWALFNSNAYHFVRGKGCSGHYGYHFPPTEIKLCNDFFGDVAGYAEADKPKEMARRIIHEMAHWIHTDQGWVADGHDIKRPNSIIRAHGIAEKHYGSAKAKHLAEVHPSFSVRNNDNIAIFIMRLGMAVKAGTLPEFPPGGVADYPEIPNLPPLPPDKPNGGGNDPFPPSGVDKCDINNPKPFEIDWNYIRQHCLSANMPNQDF